jgi:hypothetical protein
MGGDGCYRRSGKADYFPYVISHYFPFLIFHWGKETAKPPRIAKFAMENMSLNWLRDLFRSS